MTTPSPYVNYNALAADYAIHRQVHPGVFEQLFTQGNVSASSQVLEVGCGTGNYIIRMQEIGRCLAWGVDPHQEMLAVAGRRTQKVTFSLDRAEELHFDPASFDLLFSVDVIHHITGRAQFFERAWQALKPGGKICTVTDSETIIRNRIPLSKYFPETVAVELQRYPLIADLRSIMETCHFHSIQETTVEYPVTITDVQRYRAKAFSSLHLISEEAFQKGMKRLEDDLQKGPIQGNANYTLLWGIK